LASLDWWDVFWWLTAGAGGVIVFWGLWQEKKYEKESYQSYLNVEDFRACKSKRTRGWRILMIGIAADLHGHRNQSEGERFWLPKTLWR